MKRNGITRMMSAIVSRVGGEKEKEEEKQSVNPSANESVKLSANVSVNLSVNESEKLSVNPREEDMFVFNIYIFFRKENIESSGDI